MTKFAKFNLGDIVEHTSLGYKAIIVDADPIFQASGRFNPAACKRDFATRNPWYRLLVNHSQQETYVEECNLVKNNSIHGIDNPNVEQYLKKQNGHYRLKGSIH